MNPQLKKTVADLLNWGVDLLPPGARLAILRHQIEMLGSGPILRELAKDNGISGFLVDGQYGTVTGEVCDSAVLHLYAMKGVWAVSTINILLEFFASKNGTLVDIGANIGLTTIPIARGGKVLCHCFEPDPKNFAHLSRNVAANCPSGNVTLHNVALFDRSGLVDFELSTVNMGDHRIHNGSAATGLFSEDARTIIKVKSSTLDDMLPPESVVGPLAVKIDTQGAEPFIVSGGLETMRRASLVLSEFWPYGIRRLGATPERMIEIWAQSFDEGAVLRGEGEDAPNWIPIANVCEDLRRVWQDERDAAYFDVYLRRSGSAVQR